MALRQPDSSLTGTDTRVRTRQSPFVGRSRELARLDREIGQALEGNGRIVLVTGEPGIGKTWLVRAAVARATRRIPDLDARWARCSDAVGTPAYWPWQRLLDGAFDDGGRQPSNADDVERFERHHTLAQRIGAVCAQNPRVLAIDDLQWADDDSLLLLDALASEIDAWPLIVIATVRDVGPGATPPGVETLRRHKSVANVALRGFDAAETRELAEALVDGRVRHAAVAALQRATNGNPYFAGELLRSLAPADVERLGRGAPLPSRPTRVDDLIAARLATFDEGTRALLEIAAVIGPTFPAAWLARLGSEAGNTDSLARSLDRAMLERLIEPAEEAGHLRFVHGLVPEAIRRRLPASRLADLHGRVGLLLEGEMAGGASISAAAVAHHFVAAATRPELAERALRHSRQAGHAAASQLAHELAARHYRDALSVLDTMGTSSDPTSRVLERAELLLGLGHSLAYVGDPDAGAALEQAEVLGTRELDGDDPVRAARVLAFASITRCEALPPANAPECREARARGERALAALGAGAPALRARLLAALVPLFRFETDREPLRAMATEASDLAADSGNAALQGRALGALHWALLDEPSGEHRLRIASRVLEHAEAGEDRRLAATARFWRYLDLLELGRTADAEEELALFERLAERLAEPRRRHQALFLRAGLALHRGDLERAEAVATEGLHLGMRIGIGADEATFAYFTTVSVICFVRNDLGRIAEIHQTVTEMQAQYPQVRRGSSILLAWQGQTQSAQHDLGTALEDGLDAVPRGPDWLATMQTMAWSAMELGERRPCQALYERLQRHASRIVLHHFGASTGGSVARILANLATKLGRFEEAEARFREATEIARRAQCGFDLMFLPVEWATLHLARGADRNDPTVVRLLGESLERARTAGATRVEEQVRALHPTLVDAADARDGRLTTNRFERQGSVWSVAFGGQACELPDGRGVQFIAALLRRPGEEILAADLLTEVTGETGLSAESARVRVTQRVRATLRRLRTLHPGLASHLGTYLRTGKFCGYLPSAEARVAWRLGEPPG